MLQLNLVDFDTTALIGEFGVDNKLVCLRHIFALLYFCFVFVLVLGAVKRWGMGMVLEERAEGEKGEGARKREKGEESCYTHLGALCKHARLSTCEGLQCSFQMQHLCYAAARSSRRSMGHMCAHVRV